MTSKSQMLFSARCRDFFNLSEENMAISKEKKEKIVEELTEKFSSSSAVILTNYQGLNVKDITGLRCELKEKGVKFEVIKNTLVKIALEKAGLKIDTSIFSGPVALAFDLEEGIDSSKIIYNFAKGNKNLEILGGIINKNLVDVDAIKSLALLPTREELYAKLVGSLNAPISGFINVLSGNIRNLVYVLNAYKESKTN